MTIPSCTVIRGFRLTTWLLAVPTFAYAAYVALETASYVPIPGEDTSRHDAYLFSALLGGIAVMAMSLAAVAGRTPRGSPARRTPIALTATGLGVAVLAFGLVGVTVLV